MHRIKAVLVTFAIISIATTFFTGIVIAAEVTRINKNRGLVVVNGNKEAGFVMGATVCFYSISGEEITCGRIQQTSESHATVKVNNRKAKQLRNGMEAQLEDEEKRQEHIEEQGCVDDSECRGSGYCVNGKCQESKAW